MRAGLEVLGDVLLGQDGAHREATGDALGGGQHVRLDVGPLMGEQLAGAPHAALHLVQPHQDAEFVAGGAEPAQELETRRADAAFALHGFDENAGRLRTDGVAQRIQVVERHVIEAVYLRPEAGEILLVAGRGQHRQRTAVECAVEADDPVALRLAGLRHRLAHHLDHALVGLGPRVAEEHAVGERRIHQARGQPFGLRHAIQVTGVHDLAGLLGDRRHQVLVAVTERGGRDPGAEIQHSSAVCRVQPGAFAPLESDVGTVVGGHQRGNHGSSVASSFVQPKHRRMDLHPAALNKRAV